MSDEAFTANTKNLDQMIKALKNNMSRAKVGILGSKTVRNGVEVKGGKSVNAAHKPPKGGFDATTNASLGAIHEFGIPGKMPKRSFLRMPISEKLDAELNKAGAFSKDELVNVLKEASFIPWLKRIAVLGEKVVSDAFDTGGFGKWPRWKSKGYENNTGMLLVDTQQLRNSITSEVT